jgi:hypothetical protein
VPLIGVGQQTYVPDYNFEQKLIQLGYDNVVDNYVTTANIDTLTFLNVSFENISDLTVIEDFTDLTTLWCTDNYLTSLDVSNNTALASLFCRYNQLTNLDVSNNTALVNLDCNTNQLTSLDVSNNTALSDLWCYDNQLTYLDIRNGNNTNMGFFDAGVLYPGIWCQNNPYLTCISVDDHFWSSNNWTVANGNIDPQHYFLDNCIVTSVQEKIETKELLKVTDLLGREVNKKRNTPLFYIYNDGTVEKKIILE